MAGLATSVPVIAIAAFFGGAGGPVLGASSQAIRQRKVPVDLQGKVFGVRAMIASSFAPLAYATSGPLADRVFDPLLIRGWPPGSAPDGVRRRADPGHRPAAGGASAVGAAALAVATTTGPIRGVESDLPDAVPDPEPGVVPAAEIAS